MFDQRKRIFAVNRWLLDLFLTTLREGSAPLPEGFRVTLPKVTRVEQVTALAKDVGGYILEDEALLDEVTNLVERPTPLRGTFEQRYLELPREVLVTVMRDKQRYFAILEPGEYFYCACGRSKTQPFCDGSHEGGSAKPMPFTIAERQTVALCGCRKSKTKPFCDATHLGMTL